MNNEPTTATMQKWFKIDFDGVLAAYAKSIGTQEEEKQLARINDLCLNLEQLEAHGVFDRAQAGDFYNQFLIIWNRAK